MAATAARAAARARPAAIAAQAVARARPAATAAQAVARPRPGPGPPPGARRLAAASIAALATGAALLTPAPTAAQAGAGTATGAVLQIPAGSRAAGLGGAYTAARDGDALFYNPASAAWYRLSAGVAHQAHVVGSGFSSLGAAVRLPYVSVGLTLAVLNYGTIAELVPDPAFDGQRGIETGERVGASDLATRLVVAVPLPGSRWSVGGAAGLFWSFLAESARTVPTFDAGVQFRATDEVSFGASLRNAGRQLTGSRLAAVDLPTDLRAGAVWAPRRPFFSAIRGALHADAIVPLHDAATSFATGAEATAVPGSLGGEPLTASARVGYNGSPGSNAFGRFHYGAGLALQRFAVDYTVQPMGDLGVTHRLGLRWSR